MSLSEKLVGFTNPTSPSFGISSSVAVGALTLVDPARLHGKARTAVHAATGAVTGWTVATSVNRDNTVRAPLKAVVGLAAAGASMALADKSDRLDARMVQALRSAGLRHPRWWLAAGASALMFGSYLLDRATTGAGTRFVTLEEAGTVRPIDPAARKLVEGMLTVADIPGSEVLLAQLERAEELSWDEEFDTTLTFQIPDDVPRVVPHDQTYPVHALFEAANGFSFRLRLQTVDGKLDFLAVEAADDDYPDPIYDLIDRWPTPSAVRYVLEGPDGGAEPVGPEWKYLA